MAWPLLRGGTVRALAERKEVRGCPFDLRFAAPFGSSGERRYEPSRGNVVFVKSEGSDIRSQARAVKNYTHPK